MNKLENIQITQIWKLCEFAKMQNMLKTARAEEEKQQQSASAPSSKQPSQRLKKKSSASTGVVPHFWDETVHNQNPRNNQKTFYQR